MAGDDLERRAARVVVTGAAGRIGRTLTPTLAAAGYRVTGFDTAPRPPTLADEIAWQVGDIRDRAAMRAVLTGQDALIHLAAHPTPQTWEEAAEPNLNGAVVALESAGEAGVAKVVYASSIHAFGYAGLGERFDDRTPVRPDGPYGVSKLFGEAVTRFVHDRYGPSAYVLRIGTCRPEPMTLRERSTWISPTDLGRLVLACLAHEGGGHRILWAFSRNSRADIDRAAWAEVGYVPQDDVEDHLDKLSNPDAGTPGDGLVGGRFVRGRGGLTQP